VLDELPVVIQLNKRDLPNVAAPSEILALLDPEGRRTAVEASAVTGKGVFETLKEISKATIRTLRKRMSGDEPSKPAIQMTVRRPAEAPAAPRPATQSNTVAFPSVVNTPIAPLSHPEAPAAAASSGSAALAAEPMRAQMPHIEEPVEAPKIPPVTLEAPVFVEPPPPQTPEPPPPVEAAPPAIVREEVAEPAAEPEVEFAQEEQPAKIEEPVVKHVKVRSNVDIMAELESLRKKATQTPSKGKRDAMSALDALSSFGKKPEVRNASMRAGADTAKKAKTVRVQVLFEDSEGNVLQTEEQSVTIESSAVQSLLVNLKVEIGS
jgi:hypothetical protein